jgi:YbbR domain-containing protein
LNSKRLLTIITEKWHFKVLSLAAAVVISIFYRMNNIETRFFTVPLLIESSDILLPANSYPSSVKISVRGEAEGIQPILAEDIEAFIDLGKYINEGSYRVPIQIRKKGRALGIEPLEVSVLPIEISLHLEQKMTHNINVFPVLTGTVANGYELTNQSLTPARVITEGPRSIFDSHIEFKTEPINLDRRYEDFFILVNINNDNPLLFIRGSNILEFRGSIRRIAREEQEEDALQIDEDDLQGGEQ